MPSAKKVAKKKTTAKVVKKVAVKKASKSSAKKVAAKVVKKAAGKSSKKSSSSTSLKKKIGTKKTAKTNARMSMSARKSTKTAIKKALPKKPVKKVAIKKPAAKVTSKKTVTKKPIAKVSAKKTMGKKTTGKKTAPKVAAKKTVIKKTIAKVSPKKTAAKTASKKPATTATNKRPVVKAPAKKRIASTIIAPAIVAEVITAEPLATGSAAKQPTTKAAPKKTPIKIVVSENSWRLPRVAIPKHYLISLQPDLENKTFSGKVEIDVAVHEPTDTIVLNAKEIDITQALIVGLDDKEVKASVSYNKEKEFGILTLPETIAIGHYKILCQFTGVLNDKLKGFYSSSWTDEAGVKHPLAVTQFESTDARRAFPCFDEPDFKATYDVTLIVPKNLKALSNGRIIGESINNETGLKTVHFRKTMKMSTYLLAFLVGEFVPSAAKMANGVELRCWTVPGKEKLTSFALEVAAHTINYFEKYFGVPYPDPDKCDLIAIPDFAAGAMENKDCITFRETALLVDETTATHGELERVAEVIMHELAHMWFGDLVTMRWWNGLWLNEAFATFMEVKALNNFRPEWKVWDKFGMSRAAAMRVDSLKHTHPIESPVVNPDDAQELFDVISYQKGCSVLYQIEQFIGEDIFQKGINHYLHKHAYGNTETHDLWDSLELACANNGINIPVRAIMDNWVFVAGHPIVSVKEGSDHNSIEFSQKPFRFIPDNSINTTYEVPLTTKVKFASGDTLTEKILLNDKSRAIRLGKEVKYIVANAGGSGFYRVSYSSSLANKLLAQPEENLSVIERFNLVNDSWAALRAGYLPVSEYLDMIRSFKNEDDVSVWSIILSSLNILRSMTEGESRANFKQFVKTLCVKKAQELGWEPQAHESSQTKQLRGLLIETLGLTAEDSHTYEQAQKYFERWQHDKTAIDSNILPAVVYTLAYHGDTARYEEYKALSKHAKTPQETLRFLYALAYFRDITLLEETMASCLNGDVRTQDAPFLLITIANNEIATKSAWAFLQKNFEQMTKTYPDTGMVRMCSNIIPALDDAVMEKEANKFFASHKVKAGDMAISQALEQLRVNVSLKERESKNLAEYLKEHQ